MSRSTSVLPSVLAAGLAALLAPTFLSAQLRTEITPFAASYYGATHLLSDDAGGFFANNPFTVDQDNAFALGGRVTIPVGSQLAIEGEFAYATSGLSVTEQDAFGSGLDGGISQNGNIMFGSVRAVYSPRRSNLFLLLGPAVITRGGDAWEGVDSGDITDFGGVFGLGFRANVTPRFRLNITAETYLYSFDGGGPDSEFQSDILISIGVPIALGGR